MKKPNFLALNPSAILFAVNAVIALALAWGANWSPDITGIVDGVITAVLTLITTAMTRPINLQLVLGGAAALIAALAPFGLHLTADQVSSGTVVLSLLLAGIFHLAHYPYVAVKRGTTGNALQGIGADVATDPAGTGPAGTTPAAV